MDHPSELSGPQPWRSAALVAATVAAVELCLLVVVGLLVLGRFFAGEVEKATDPATATRAAVERGAEAAGAAEGERKRAGSTLPRRETSVIVLNGNGVAGAAAGTAEQVRSHRYVIAATGNAPRATFSRSVVMYRPGFRGEAKRLANDVGVARVAPLDGLRARDLQGAHVALVVGG